MIEAKDRNGNRIDELCVELEIIKVGNDYIASCKNEKGALLMKNCKSLEEAKEFLKGLL